MLAYVFLHLSEQDVPEGQSPATKKPKKVAEKTDTYPTEDITGE